MQYHYEGMDNARSHNLRPSIIAVENIVELANCNLRPSIIAVENIVELANYNLRPSIIASSREYRRAC